MANIIGYKAIANMYDKIIVVVATEGAIGDWACYCGYGYAMDNYEEVVNDVAEDGEKLLEEWARAFFPEFKDKPYRR